jgi:hypothetical protein
MTIKPSRLLAILLAASLAACAPLPASDEALSVEPAASVATQKQLQLDSLLAAAQQGKVEAQFVLAQAYEVGKGVAMNLDSAFFWYGKAAEAGYVPAQFFLGAMYGSSRGTPLDLPKAIFWYRQAAEQGYPDALYPMAYVYEHGLGGETQNNEQALAWYRKAAETGNAFAFLRLSKAYRFGELGLNVDAEQAGLYAEKQKAAGGAKLISVPVGAQ